MSPSVVVSFVGPSGVGKTTLVERVIAELRTRGVLVGSVKHAPHGFDVDRPGSDSYRHRSAGADRVLLAGTDHAVLFIDEGRGVGVPPGSTASGHHGPVAQPGTGGGLTAGPDQSDESSPTHPMGRVERVGEWIDQHLGSCDVVLVEGFTPMSELVVQVARWGIPPKTGNELSAPTITVTDQPDGSGQQIGFDHLDTLVDRILDARHAPER